MVTFIHALSFNRSHVALHSSAFRDLAVSGGAVYIERIYGRYDFLLGRVCGECMDTKPSY